MKPTRRQFLIGTSALVAKAALPVPIAPAAASEAAAGPLRVVIESTPRGHSDWVQAALTNMKFLNQYQEAELEAAVAKASMVCFDFDPSGGEVAAWPPKLSAIIQGDEHEHRENKGP